MEVKSEESNEFQTNDTELQLKSLKKILGPIWKLKPHI